MAAKVLSEDDALCGQEHQEYSYQYRLLANHWSEHKPGWYQACANMAQGWLPQDAPSAFWHNSDDGLAQKNQREQRLSYYPQSQSLPLHACLHSWDDTRISTF